MLVARFDTTLPRFDVMAALDREPDGLTMSALAKLREVKIMIVTGAGWNFCYGGDVHEIIAPLTEKDMVGLLDFTRMTGDLVKAMRGCPQPIISAIDGICAGAGAIIAMASDM